MNSQENSRIGDPLLALMSRASELIREIHKLSDISEEALQNNRVWHTKYAKLKDLFLKNITDELTLEDLIAGNADFRDFEAIGRNFQAFSQETGKNFQANGRSEAEEARLKEMSARNREKSEELREFQGKLHELKRECAKLEQKVAENSESRESRELERKYQGKIADLEREIAKVKENIRESAENERKFEALTNDFSRLKEEKRKMEVFYAKKLKELEQEFATKPKKPSNFNENVEKPPNYSEKLGNSEEIAGFGPRTMGNREKFPGKGFEGLETINEIRTNERIEEIVESQISVSTKKLPEIAEEQGKSVGKQAKVEKKEPVIAKNTAKTVAAKKTVVSKKGKK